jgi:hypothetical protein
MGSESDHLEPQVQEARPIIGALERNCLQYRTHNEPVL